MSSSSKAHKFDLTSDLPVSPKGYLLLALVAVLSVGFFLGPIATTRALWTDELFSLLTMEYSTSEIWMVLSNYQRGFYDHPPLFFVLLKPILYLGDSPITLRLPIMLTMAIALTVCGIAVAQLTGRLLAGLFLIPILLLNPAVFEMGQFFRMYALTMLLGAIIAWTMIRLLDSRETRDLLRQAILLAVTLTLLAYTTYFALVLTSSLLLLAFLLCLYGFVGERRHAHHGFAIAGACALAAVAYLPWFTPTLQLLAAENQPTRSILEALYAFVVLVIEATGSFSALLLIAVFLPVAARAHPRLLLLTVFLFLVPLAAIVVRAPADRPLAARYLLFALPIVFFMATVGVHHGIEFINRRLALKKSGRAILATIILISAAASQLAGHGRLPEFQGPDWWAAAQTVEGHIAPQDIVLTGGFLSGEALLYHMHQPENVRFLHYVTHIDDFYLASQNPRVTWYVNAAPLPEGFARIVRRYFPHRITIVGNGNTILGITIASKSPFYIKGVGNSTEHEVELLEWEL